MRTPQYISIAGLVLIGITLASCAGGGRPVTEDRPMTTAQPRIELLGFPDCPNTPELRANLTAALASIGKGWTFKDTDQEKLPEGDIRRGYPTPTVLVNDRDLYGLPVPTAPSMGCRMYPGGVPDAEEMASRIEAATPR